MVELSERQEHILKAFSALQEIKDIPMYGDGDHTRWAQLIDKKLAAIHDALNQAKAGLLIST